MSTIVLAETNASTRKRLTRILAKNRYTIKQLKPSEDVVGRLKDKGPNLLVFDLAVREAKGFGFEELEEILRGAPDVPVLVLTPSKPRSVFRKVLALGATDYVVKPFEDVEFRHRVDTLLKKTLHLLAGEPPSLAVPEMYPLTVPLQSLHDASTGRMDATKVAKYLGVPLAKLADALGSNYTAAHKTPAAAGLQKQLTPIKQSLAILSEMIGDASTVRVWLNSPHPDLGKRRPIDVILEGRAGALLAILENARDGIPS